MHGFPNGNSSEFSEYMTNDFMCKLFFSFFILEITAVTHSLNCQRVHFSNFISIH